MAAFDRSGLIHHLGLRSRLDKARPLSHDYLGSMCYWVTVAIGLWVDNARLRFRYASVGACIMDKFVALANIDHYLSLLYGSSLTPPNRSTITKLLVAEEDKLGRDLEQLEFAENRTAKSRERVNHFRRLRDSFVEGSPERAHADRTLANIEAIYIVMDQFCHQMRKKVNSRGL